MRVVGVREFRNRAPELVRQKDLIFITRHGQLTSLLVPLDHPQSLPVELRRELLERTGRAISAYLSRKGISERRVLRDFEAWRRSRRANRRRR